MIHGLRIMEGADMHPIYRSIKQPAEIAEAESVQVTFFFDEE